MKIVEFPDYRNYITKFDLANIFNVYDDYKLGIGYKSYNLNRGITISGLDKIPATELTTYKVKEGDNLNIISYNIYGTIQLWWLLAKINNITDATLKLQPGWELYTLNKTNVNQILNALRT